VVASYLGKLDAALASQKFPGNLQIVQSNGGIMSTATARKFRCTHRAVRSGRRVVAGAAIARAAGYDNLITCDLGGTSFDVSVWPAAKNRGLLRKPRWTSGLVIRTPMIEITTIGAGGGPIASSIARPAAVGPESDGSVPGRPVMAPQHAADADHAVCSRINAAQGGWPRETPARPLAAS
jgi:N-methylhydantoinase A